MTTPKAPDGHSALPWTAKFAEGITIHEPDGSRVAQITMLTRTGRRAAALNEGNARLIVEAVNAHPTLTARIEELEGALQWLISLNNGVGKSGEAPSITEWNDAWDRARTTLESRK